MLDSIGVNDCAFLGLEPIRIPLILEGRALVIPVPLGPEQVLVKVIERA